MLYTRISVCGSCGKLSAFIDPTSWSASASNNSNCTSQHHMHHLHINSTSNNINSTITCQQHMQHLCICRHIIIKAYCMHSSNSTRQQRTQNSHSQQNHLYSNNIRNISIQQQQYVVRLCVAFWFILCLRVYYILNNVVHDPVNVSLDVQKRRII